MSGLAVVQFIGIAFAIATVLLVLFGYSYGKNRPNDYVSNRFFYGFAFFCAIIAIVAGISK